jgi:NADH:ubiquinone oxidoreductase subunit 2 (subunit N)
MVILVLTTIASYWYYLRVAWYMWMRDSDDTGSPSPFFSSLPMQVALIATVALILYTGLFPGQAIDFARASVEGLATWTQ